ncbi:MAG TPA: hypothetical protein VLE99_02590 [Candidatus Saccharimonadales bacterium]|nr:hypothetical protein [Candidatus Saccharimonadales bacterium]
MAKPSESGKGHGPSISAEFADRTIMVHMPDCSRTERRLAKWAARQAGAKFERLLLTRLRSSQEHVLLAEVGTQYGRRDKIEEHVRNVMARLCQLVRQAIARRRAQLVHQTNSSGTTLIKHQPGRPRPAVALI